MSKRKSKAQKNAMVGMLVAGFLLMGIGKFFTVVGFAAPLLICVAVGLGILFYRMVNKRRRIKHLSNKYAQEVSIQPVLQHQPWEGQTSQELIDSLGFPVSKDTKVLQTKKREVWKYGHRGGNSYRLRVTLDNGIVVGWDAKDL